MIYTLTLNPAVDYTLFMDNLIVGNICRSQRESINIGGKGINVSLVLNELNVDTEALGFVAGFTGNFIKQELTRRIIKHDLVTLSSGNTRINVKIKHGEETDINAGGPIIDKSSLDLLFKKLVTLTPDDTLVLSGSLPSGCGEDLYEKIAVTMRNQKVPFVVDTTKNLLLSTLKYKPFLIKPNIDELSEVFSVKLSTPLETVDYAKKLRKLGACNVLVSCGKDGAVLFDENDKVYMIDAPKGKAINTVGAGDSMVAGFIAGYCETKNPLYALKLATACASATAFSEDLASRDKIFEMLPIVPNAKTL